jgi:hypothetical protein
MLKSFLGLGLPLLGVCAVAGSALAQTAPLTASQKATLKSLGIAIAVPRAVPLGYTVSRVDVTPCPANAPREKKGICRFGPNYSIVYRNAAQKRCFAIEGTGGGVGGVGFEYEVPVDTPLWGRVSLRFGQQNGALKAPSKQQLASPQKNLLMDWGGTGAFYRLAGFEFIQEHRQRNAQSATQCQSSPTPNEAIKVMRSLTWLK